MVIFIFIIIKVFKKIQDIFKFKSKRICNYSGMTYVGIYIIVSYYLSLQRGGEGKICQSISISG